ncbi:MAG: oligosaccharide repeat unit polymerase, partial [Oribacterium sinus]|nr:oligosaccharide repeat unit polymerase [Oribacterium sinus]
MEIVKEAERIVENLQKTKGPALNGKQNHSRNSLFFDLCLYTVLYGMAYLLKEKGYAVLSFFCFLILSLYLFLREREREGSSVTLPGLFALGLLLGEGVATLQLSKLSSPWTIHTWLSFYLAYLLFYLGYHGRTYLSEFAASRSLKNTKIFSEEVKKVDLSDKKYRWNFTEGQFLKLCILGLLLISYFSFAIEALALGYIPLFTEHTPHAYSYFHLKGLHYFTTLFVLVPMLLPFLYQKEGSLKLFSGISLFLALLLPILLVSRFQLLFSLFLFVFSALYQGLRIR